MNRLLPILVLALLPAALLPSWGWVACGSSCTGCGPSAADATAASGCCDAAGAVSSSCCCRDVELSCECGEPVPPAVPATPSSVEIHGVGSSLSPERRGAEEVTPAAVAVVGCTVPGTSPSGAFAHRDLPAILSFACIWRF